MWLLIAAGRRRGSPPAIDPPPYDIPTAYPFNAPEHLTTPTYDGSGNTVHSDVIDFWTMHGIPAWNGYRFWMVHTPYPNDNDDYENPSILASHNGWQWETPPGLTNPIYPWPGGSLFNFDTDWAYDPDTGELVLIFGQGGYGWVVCRSSDGATWPAQPLPLMSITAPPEDPVSKSLVRMDDGTWRMFAIADTSRAVYRWTAPAPEGPWTGLATFTGWSSSVWHLDVVRVGSTLYALVVTSGTTNFYVAKSTNGGDGWSTLALVIPRGISGNWDRTKLYRGTLQPHENGTHMRVWYCGRSGTGPAESWHVGLTHIPLNAFPA